MARSSAVSIPPPVADEESREFLHGYLELVRSLVLAHPRLCEHDVRSVCLESLWRNQSRIEAATKPLALARTICRRRIFDLYRREKASTVSLERVAERASSPCRKPEVMLDLDRILIVLAVECSARQWRALVDMLRGVPRSETAAALAVTGPRVSQLRAKVRALAHAALSGTPTERRHCRGQAQRTAGYRPPGHPTGPMTEKTVVGTP